MIYRQMDLIIQGQIMLSADKVEKGITKRQRVI